MSQLDPAPTMTDIERTVTESARIPFLGLEEHSNAEYPDEIQPIHPMYSESPVTLTDIIKLLPAAEENEVKGVNTFINDDGTVDAEQIKQAIDVDKLSIDPEDITNSDKYTSAPNYKEIVDPRRQALHALGADIRYRWQISTSSYTIINPQDAYWPAYKTFKQQGEANTIFGWVDYRNYGGVVDIYILFSDKTLDQPHTDKPLFVGFQTGYDFTGGRAMDVEPFGFNPEEGVRMYSLGRRRSRRHVGDPNNPQHERDQNRVPIKDWWQREYENIIEWTDELARDIQKASNTTIDFSTFEFGIREFYSYLDIPDSYVEETDNGKGAVKRARLHSGDGSKFSMWTLFYALVTTLEEEFQGDSHTSAQFKVYADLGTNILRKPHTTIQNVRSEHLRQLREKEEDNQTKRERAIDDQLTLDQAESLDDIDGITTEDDLDLTSKRVIAQSKQKTLFGEE